MSESSHPYPEPFCGLDLERLKSAYLVGESVPRVDTTMKDAIQSIALVMKYAIKNKLDITMIASSLRRHVREDLYLQYEHCTFADQLEQILDLERTVRILIWNEPSANLLAQSVVNLIETRGERTLDSKPGRIDVRLSGTSKYWESVCHFICAHDRNLNRRPHPIGFRVEEPHPSLPLDDSSDPKPKSLQAVTIFGESAMAYAAPWLESFENMFYKIGSRCPQKMSRRRRKVGIGIEASTLLENGR